MPRMSRDDVQWKEMVFCPPMKTYVPVAFCLNGGPMKAKGKCEWFIEIKVYPPTKPGAEPARDVIHMCRTSQRIESHVMMKGKTNGL